MLPVLSPLGKLSVSDGPLRFALYKAYRGRCQYCIAPKQIQVDEMHVEHIIPRSIPRENVSALLQVVGVSELCAEDFCARFLPPRHDCVLNYTLACSHHNLQKGGILLHPVALEALLRRARQKAKRVLQVYAKELVHRQTTPSQ